MAGKEMYEEILKKIQNSFENEDEFVYQSNGNYIQIRGKITAYFKDIDINYVQNNNVQDIRNSIFIIDNIIVYKIGYDEYEFKISVVKTFSLKI